MLSSTIAQTQYQMSDELYYSLLIYMHRHQTTLSELCKKHRWPEYITSCVMDRTMKMHIYYSLLYNIAESCDLEDIKISTNQPTKIARDAKADKKFRAEEAYRMIHPDFTKHLRMYVKTNSKENLLRQLYAPEYVVECCLIGKCVIQFKYLCEIALVTQYKGPKCADDKNP